MRSSIISAFLMFAFLLLTSDDLAVSKSVRTPSVDQIVIRVVEGGWGDADVKDIEAVLHSTAKELLKYFPNKSLQIRVEHGASPITLYRRGSNGEYIVRLSVEGTYWAQFAYQFSHELTHVLARHEDTKEDRNHQWFEESLCVTASMFTLRQMAITWRTSAPYSNWKNYASALRRYADNEMSERGRQVPSNMTFASWYKETESELESEDVDSPEARNKQFVVASQLLPIFEKNPDSWESVSYLSVRKTDGSYLQNYLNNWYRSAPEKHKSRIREISYLFRE